LRFSDIKQFTRRGSYAVNQSWAGLMQALAFYKEDGLDLNPDFQRGHVWGSSNQIAYLEFILRGGESARDIYFNHPELHTSNKLGYSDFVLVDGKQRLQAVLLFLDNKIKVFKNYYFKDFEDTLPWLVGPDFLFHVNDLKTKREVLVWYLEMNSGGVVHTEEELCLVKTILEQEK